MLESDVKVRGGHLSLLVARSIDSHLVRGFHTGLDEDGNACLLLLDSAAVKAKHLLLVRDLLLRAVVHLFKSHIDSDGDVLGRRGLGLI